MTKEPEGPYTDVARRLIAIRTAMDIESAKDFADLCGIPRSRYYQLESGGFRVGYEYVQKVKEATGYSMDWVYTGDTQTLTSAKLTELRNIANGVSSSRTAQK